jgi:hypothetical protein
LLPELVELTVGILLDIDKVVTGAFEGFDQLVKLEVHRPGISVLSVLDQKHHQKCRDGSSGIDHQLPGIGEVKQRTADRPDDDKQQRKDEGSRTTDRIGYFDSDFVEQVLHMYPL